jgi:hypothetical protein
MRKQNFRFSSRIAGTPRLFGVLVLLGALMTATPALAGVSCHMIDATAAGQDVGGGSTTANVINGGLLQGTIAGSLTIIGVSGNVATFVETVTFTNQHGTLTVVVTGGIDVNTGQFNASGPVTAATGKLSGATGNISFKGAANFATGIFTEAITGVVCVDLAP